MHASWRQLPEHPIVLGHRGARHAHPENTLRAFQAALDEGAWGTEFDVVLSADGAPMVFHDDDLARMTQQRDVRRVRQLTASELQAVALPEGETIPALQAVLDWAREQGALLNIELKSNRPLRDPIAQVVAELLRTYPEAPDFALVSSFHPALLRAFVRHAPQVTTGLLVDKNHRCLVNQAWLSATRSRAVHPNAALLDEMPDLLARVPNAMVNTWTVNDTALGVRLARLGVKGIITDRPGAILDALRASDLHP